MSTAQSVYTAHSTVVQLSERAFALSVAASIYDDCRKEEQRILRAHQRLVEEEQVLLQRLAKCREDQHKYGQIIGVE